MSAGTIPAANRSAIETPPPATAANRMRLWEGGSSSATSDAEIVTSTA